MRCAFIILLVMCFLDNFEAVTDTGLVVSTRFGDSTDKIYSNLVWSCHCERLNKTAISPNRWCREYSWANWL
jgi:hypothetical protein